MRPRRRPLQRACAELSRARAVLIFACVYALGMIARYAILRTHEIPAAFHLVLAAFLFVYGVRQRSEAKLPRSPSARRPFATLRL